MGKKIRKRRTKSAHNVSTAVPGAVSNTVSGTASNPVLFDEKGDKRNKRSINDKRVSITRWRQDISLAAIGERLSTMRGGVLSIDFFDTLIHRLCNEPVHLFVEVGYRLQKTGLLNAEFTPVQFRELRRAAEMKARQRRFWKDNTTEITLSHIYAELFPAVVSNAAESAECELQTEADYCFVNPGVESLMHYALSLGNRVCILSDMYLNGDQLRYIAQANGLDLDAASLVATSCEYGNGKTSGFLFKHAMAQLQVSPYQMIHLGDNIDADTKGAQKAGVTGVHYYRTNGSSDYVYGVENKLNDGDLSVGINGIRTLAARQEAVGNNPYIHAGCFTVGPLLTHFADWTVTECKKRGIKKVLAFMREGRLLRELLLNSANAQNVDLQIEECFISREAVHLASVGEAIPENITERVYARTVSEMFQSFGIGPELTRFPDNIASQEVNTVELLSTLVRYLTTGKIRSIVEQKSAEARKLFLKYFTSLANDTDVALIDVGWGGSMQRNIVRILQLENINIACHGFYLANTAASCQVALKGATLRGFLGSYNEYPQFMETLIRSPEMIEQVASAPIGTTIGYSENGGVVTPVLSDEVVDTLEQQHREDVQKGVRLYQQTWLDVRQRKQSSHMETSARDNIFNNDSALSCACRAITARLINYPTKSEAMTLGQFHHDDGFYSKSVSLIASPEKVALLENDGYSVMKKSPRTYWPQGVLAQADETLVKQLACGMEVDFQGDSIGKATTSETLFERHQALSANDIADVKIQAGDWLFYTIEMNCPHCGARFNTRLVGTYTVLQSVACHSCLTTFVLTFDAIDAFLLKYYPNLANDTVSLLTAETMALIDVLNVSLSEQDDVPLLASLSNMICVNSLSRLMCKEIIETGEDR